MNKTTKRIFPILATLVLMISLLLVVALPTQAAGELTLDVNGLTAEWTDASNSQGKAEWSGSGNAITGEATGYKQVINKEVTTTLTLTNNLTETAQLTFDYTLDKGSVKADVGTLADGKFSYEIPAGASVVITQTSPKGVNNKGTLEITNISLLVAGGIVDSTFLPADQGGNYTVTPAGGAAQVITEATTLTQENTQDYALNATPVDGYVFFGWYSEAKQSYLSYESPVSLKFAEDPQLKPVFVSEDAVQFSVNSAKFIDLTEAGAFAAQSGATQINMLNSGTISGEHTIPAGVTLLVPFDAANTCYTDTPAVIPLVSGAPSAWEVPYAYRTLILAADAKITVNGAISVSAMHSPGNAAGQQTVGSPSGACGWIEMAAGSEIILNNGANLYAWGYIEGEGEITAKSGATVYENIQFTDFRGGSATSQMATEFLVFPMSQYYVQNIEVLTTYEAGANEYVYTSIYMSKQVFSAGVKFVGAGGMFNAVDGYVTKDYIEAKDRLAVTTSGTAQLNGLTLSVGGTSVDSSQFVLPINSNIDITIASGTTTVNQSMAMLPGSTLTVNNGAKMILASMEITSTEEGLGVAYVGAHNFIIYDADNWTWGLDLNDENLETTVTGNFVHSAQRIRPLSFSAANGTKVVRTAASLKDVVFDINGTVITQGYLYTTAGVGWTGNGAQIISSLKTGKLIMENGAGQDMLTVQANYTNGAVVYLAIPMMSAQLRNGDDSLTDTTGAAPGSTFYYNAAEDKWMLAEDATVTFDPNGGSGSMNSIPVDKTVIANGGSITLPANTFTNGALTFIGWNTMADGSGTNYAGGASIVVTGDITLYAQWKSNKITYTWMNGYNNTPIKSEEVEEGSAPNHPANPTKPADVQYTYTFDKWASSVDSNGNVTYTATYTQAVNSYEITWDINGDTTGEDYDYGVTPSYKGETPTKPGDGKHITYTFEGWSPAISAVTGNATYTAQFKQNVSACEDKNNDHKCDTCGDKVSEHEGGVATCKVGKICVICNQVYSGMDYTNHESEDVTYIYNGNKTHTVKHICCNTTDAPVACDDKTGDRDHKCDLCQATVTEHTGGTATCKDFAECTECGAFYGQKDPNNHTEGTGYSYSGVGQHKEVYICCGVEVSAGTCVDENKDHTCELCYGKASEHTGGEATCNTLAICEICKQPYGNLASNNHVGNVVYVNNGANHTSKYEGCGHVINEAEAHTYSDDFVCSCGEKYNGVFTNSEGKIYYVENGVAVANKGLVRNITADGEVNYYYFGCNQESCTNASCKADVYTARKDCVHWVAKDNGLLPNWDYTFGTDGTIAHDDAYAKHENPETALHAVVTYEDGKYYTIDGVKAYMGLYLADDGAYYYVRSSGKLAVNCTYWISKTNGLMKEGSYTFDEEGRMVIKNEPQKNGIIEEDGALWLYKDGQKYYGGLFKHTDGTYYYAKTSGEIVTGKSYWISKTNGILPEGKYTFNEQGQMDMTGLNVDTETVDPDFTGIKTASDGTMYYYQNGQRYYAGLIKIDGDLYYVNSKYQVVTGRYWISKTNDLMKEAAYTFGADGKMN